jgi:hypothetical protein
MALPVAPPPKSNDVAVQAWTAVTVRITWTLLMLGVKVRPEVLRDVRTHVLYHLDPAIPMTHAEDLATQLTESFVARVRGQSVVDPAPQDWEMRIHPRWRRTLDRSFDHLSAEVFRKRYADNRAFERIERDLSIDRTTLEGVIHGLREGVRDIAIRDRLPLESWSPERLDRLLRRLAAWSPGPCPPALDIAEGCHTEHQQQCTRCFRMYRLVHTDMLRVDELFPPSLGARPTQRTRVLALQVHPEARAHRASLLRELPGGAFPYGDDRILVPGAALDAIAPLLRMAAEVEAPYRRHLRGAIVEGPGQWTTRGLLGPLGDRASREVLHRTWGHVDGVGELPAPLPEPPSARGWWGLAGVATVCAAATVAFGLGLSPHAEPPGLEAEFTPGRGGIWASFDVPDEDYVYVVRASEEGLQVVLASDDAGDKIDWATGDGTYRLHAPGNGMLVAASPAPLPDFALRVARTQGAPDALAALAEDLSPDATVSWTER